MKRILLILMLLGVFSGIAGAQSFEPILVGVGSEARWSPNESAIAFLKGDSLFVKSLTPDLPAQGIYYAPIVTYEWLDDSSLVTYEKTTIQVPRDRIRLVWIKKLSSRGEVSGIAKDSSMESSSGLRLRNLQRFADGSVGYFDESRKSEAMTLLNRPTGVRDSTGGTSNKVLYVDSRPIPWGQIWMFYGDDGVGRQVTHSQDHYLLPRISPEYDKFLCYNGHGNLVVFDTLGRELVNLGKVDFGRWSPDGQYITFCEIEESEFDYLRGDVLVARFDGTERRNLTSTPDKVELEPSFSPSSKYVLYREHPSDNLYVIRFR